MGLKPSEKSAMAIQRELLMYEESAKFLEQCVAAAPNNYVKHILESEFDSIKDKIEAILRWPIFADVTIIGVNTRETLNVPIGIHYQNGHWTRYNWMRESFARKLRLNIDPPFKVPENWHSDETIPTIGNVSFAVEILGCHVPGIWANVASNDELEYDLTIDTPSLRTHRIAFNDGKVDVSLFDPNIYL